MNGWRVSDSSSGPLNVGYRAALAEHREIERFALPKPDYVCRVIGKIIAGVSVGEDGKAQPIEYSPCRKNFSAARHADFNSGMEYAKLPPPRGRASLITNAGKAGPPTQRAILLIAPKGTDEDF